MNQSDAAEYDIYVRVYDGPTGCLRAAAGLSLAEWQQYLQATEEPYRWARSDVALPAADRRRIGLSDDRIIRLEDVRTREGVRIAYSPPA